MTYARWQLTYSHVTLNNTTLMSNAEEYDKLTPEEREAKDKADRKREAEEQAG